MSFLFPRIGLLGAAYAALVQSFAGACSAEVQIPTPPHRPEIASGSPRSQHAAIQAMIKEEARKVGLPSDIAEAVVHVESGFDPTLIGNVGEIGLMQVRPATAAMLGFHGDQADLAKPETNIHYGVEYLGQAWHLANGDLCRALMKYRAGHGEEVMTPLSVTYCNRARGHLAALGSPFGGISPTPSVPAFVAINSKTFKTFGSTGFKVITPEITKAFWKAHEARIKKINARLEAKWHLHRVASR